MSKISFLGLGLLIGGGIWLLELVSTNSIPLGQIVNFLAYFEISSLDAFIIFIVGLVIFCSSIGITSRSRDTIIVTQQPATSATPSLSRLDVPPCPTCLGKGEVELGEFALPCTDCQGTGKYVKPTTT